MKKDDKQLSKILEFAKKKVPFYKENGIDFDSSNSVLTKELLLDNYDKLFPEGVDRNSLLPEFTSGSTGKSLRVYKSKMERFVITKIMYSRRKLLYPNVSKSEMTKFETSNNLADSKNGIIMEPFKGESKIYFPNLYITKENVIKYKQIIDNIPETWIYGSPSAVYKLALEIEKMEDFPIEKIKLIELAGEYVVKNQREHIEKVFKCPVANQYGSREVWGIAYECPEGKMHVISENVDVEILDDNNNVLPYGEEGKVCVTSKINYSMPIIRYLVGDTGKLVKSENCSCGLCDDILELNTGRAGDVIYLQDGSTMKSVFLFQVMSYINKEESIVEQFQIRQNSYLDFSVLFVLADPDKRAAVEEKFMFYMKKYIDSEATVTFNYADDIEIDSKTKKLRYFYPMKQA